MGDDDSTSTDVEDDEEEERIRYNTDGIEGPTPVTMGLTGVEM